MAAIDKIYGTYRDHVELYDWMKKNKPEYCQWMRKPEDLSHLYENEERSISNFPESVDMWLLNNCPITWVTDRIKQQYGLTRIHHKPPVVKRNRRK